MESKNKYYHIIIEFHDNLNNKDNDIKSIDRYCSENLDLITFYAVILHDKDIDDNGVYKRKHYHLHINLRDGRGKKTIINDISKSLMININCISVLHWDSSIKSVQYLIHKNNKDKYQYDDLDIWTNDVIELDTILNQGVSSYEIDVNYLCELIKKSKSIIDVYRELGTKNSIRYRSIILDMWKVLERSK